MGSVATTVRGAVDVQLSLNSDIDRIVALPQVTFDADQQEALVTKWTEALRKTPRAPRLRPVQAVALETCALANSLGPKYGSCGTIGVGQGKTLLFCLIPEVFDAQNPLLLLPANLIKDLEAARFMWQQHYWFRPVTPLSYDILSQPNSSDLLTRFKADLFMADECHRLRNPEAARTKRFMRFLAEYPTRFVGYSGTLSSGCVNDYAGLMAQACYDLSPCPTHPHLLNLYGAILDKTAIKKPADAKAAISAIGQKLVEGVFKRRWVPFQHSTEEGMEAVRLAHGERLYTAPLTVFTDTDSVDIPLEFGWHNPPVATNTLALVKQLRTEYVLPDGDMLETDLEKTEAEAQLSNGFYYIWDWPNGKVDEDWMEARTNWHRAVRLFLKTRACEGIDSPALVRRYVEQNKEKEFALWLLLNKWDEQSVKPKPPTLAVWVDTGPMEYAANWLKSQPGPAILWYRHQAEQEKLRELGVHIWDSPIPDIDVAPKIALSMKRFGEGKQCQRWSRQLGISPGPNPTEHQQLYGRTLRVGQEAPVVHFDWFVHTQRFRRALKDAYRASCGIVPEMRTKLFLATYMDVSFIEDEPD